MPALSADPRRANAATDARTRDGGEQPLILVVEDHEDTRAMLKTVLELQGYRVALAEDGEEGVHVARSVRPQLVIMDATLPRLDGLAATRRIRLDSALQGVPVVFISGHAQPDFREAALDAGGTDVLVKPIALEVLASVLERYLHVNAA
jgi:CheY-like chemotaxis protein